MELQYYRVDKKIHGKYVCPHNDACRCVQKNCGGCGWNPKVAKRRVDKLLAKEARHG